MCNECHEAKFLHEGTCWDKCPLPLLGKGISCVKECGSSVIAPYEKFASYGGMCLLTCPESTVLLEDECLNICPEGYYEDSYNSECVKECSEE